MKSKLVLAGLALVLSIGLAGAALGQQTTAPESNETACSTNRASVQDDPSRRQTGIRVGEDADDEPRLSTVQQVARIVLYDPSDLKGRRVGITRDTPDLGERDFADIASSIRVYHGTWQLCDEANYQGNCRCFSSHTNTGRFGIGNPVTDTNLETEGFSDTVASVRLINSSRRR
jgi:ABC-type amino acid transport substrate-binding protein